MKICKMENGKLVVKNCQPEDYKAMYANGWKAHIEDKAEAVAVKKEEKKSDTTKTDEYDYYKGKKGR